MAARLVEFPAVCAHAVEYIRSNVLILKCVAIGVDGFSYISAAARPAVLQFLSVDIQYTAREKL